MFQLHLFFRHCCFDATAYDLVDMCCVCSSCRFRLANVKKPLQPSTVTVQKTKTEKSKKKRSSHFLYSRLHIEHPIYSKRWNARNRNERERQTRSVDRIYIEMMLLKCCSKKNNYEKKAHTQTNDNIVWIWKRTTNKTKQIALLPRRFRCLASTEWYTRNNVASNNWEWKEWRKKKNWTL